MKLTGSYVASSCFEIRSIRVRTARIFPMLSPRLSTNADQTAAHARTAPVAVSRPLATWTSPTQSPPTVRRRRRARGAATQRAAAAAVCRRHATRVDRLTRSGVGQVCIWGKRATGAGLLLLGFLVMRGLTTVREVPKITNRCKFVSRRHAQSDQAQYHCALLLLEVMFYHSTPSHTPSPRTAVSIAVFHAENGRAHRESNPSSCCWFLVCGTCRFISCNFRQHSPPHITPT